MSEAASESMKRRIREIAAEWYARREAALDRWLAEGAPWESIEADE